MEVLGARGSEFERPFSYGVVRQLFEPYLTLVAGAERADVLAGAAALAEPLFDAAQFDAGPVADSSLATLHGLLLADVEHRRARAAAADDRRPALVRPALVALARLPAAAHGRARPARAGRPAAGGARGGPGAGRTDRLRPARYRRPAGAAQRRGSHEARPRGPFAGCRGAFCAACREESGGNPLLLRELVRAVAAEGLAPTEANVPRLRELEAQAGSRAVSVRLSRLPAAATQLAEAVAVLGDGADPHQAAALAGLEEGATSEAAGALARVDVLGPSRRSASSIHSSARRSTRRSHRWIANVGTPGGAAPT